MNSVVNIFLINTLVINSIFKYISEMLKSRWMLATNVHLTTRYVCYGISSSGYDAVVGNSTVTGIDTNASDSLLSALDGGSDVTSQHQNRTPTPAADNATEGEVLIHLVRT